MILQRLSASFRQTLLVPGYYLAPMHTPMVVSPSGRHIGIALEVEPREILLSYAEGQTWLPNDVIFTRDDDYITLICEEAGIRRYCR